MAKKKPTIGEDIGSITSELANPKIPPTIKHPGKAVKNKMLSGARGVLMRHLGPAFQEEAEWAWRSDIKRPSLGQQPSNVGLFKTEDAVFSSLAPEIQKANWENRRNPKVPTVGSKPAALLEARETLLNEVKVSKSPAENINIERATGNYNPSRPHLDDLRRELQKQIKKGRAAGATVGAVSSAPSKTLTSLPKIIDNAKVATSLDDLIDMKKVMGSLGTYATFAIAGLDLLSSREKTPSLFGIGGAIGASYALKGGQWWTRTLGTIAGYATGRVVGSGLLSATRPEIEGLEARGVSGQLRPRNLDYFIEGEEADSVNLITARDGRPWANSGFKVKQPHMGSFTVGSVNRSLQRQHNPTISGLHEGGIAAQERHFNTEFGSGWLAKAWRGIRNLFGSGARGMRRQAEMSTPLHAILSGGGATGRDFAKKRMSGSRGIEIISEYLRKEDITIIRGKEALKETLETRFQGARQSVIEEHLEDISSAGAAYVQDLKAIYITDSADELRKKFYGTADKAELLKKAGKKALDDPMKDIEARLLGHETLEHYYSKYGRGGAVDKISSHKTPEIYRAEAELSAMLGTRATEYSIKARMPEFMRLRDEISKGVEVGLMEAAAGGSVSSGQMSKLIKPEDRVKLSYLKKSLREVKDIYRKEGVLSKQSLGNIEVTERMMRDDFAAHANRVEKIADTLAGQDREVVRRYAQAQRKAKETRTRGSSLFSSLIKETDDNFTVKRKKIVGGLQRQAEYERVAAVGGSMQRQTRSANVHGLAQTGEAAKGHGRHGFGSGIDPMRKFIAKLGKSFSEVRESVHFQKSLTKARKVGELGAGGIGSVDVMVTELERGVLGHSEEFIGPMPGLKFARKTYKEAAQATDLLRQEAQGLKALENSLTPSVYGVTDGRVLDMELIEGADTLYNYLKKGGKIKKETVDILTEGIDELHSKNLSHTDLTSLNVMVNNRGMPFIIDPMPGRYGGVTFDPNKTSRQWKDIGVAQDKMALQVMIDNVEKDFIGKSAELRQLKSHLQAISNAPGITSMSAEEALKFHRIQPAEYNYMENIHRQLQGRAVPAFVQVAEQQANQLASTMKEGLGGGKTQPAAAMERTQPARTARKHFNQRNQELMEASTIQAGVGGLPGGRRHQSMDQGDFVERLTGSLTISDPTIVG